MHKTHEGQIPSIYDLLASINAALLWHLLGLSMQASNAALGRRPDIIRVYAVKEHASSWRSVWVCTFESGDGKMERMRIDTSWEGSPCGFAFLHAIQPIRLQPNMSTL